MNALTSTPSRANYEPVVKTFLPGTEGEELQLRASLLLMRDRAMATKPIACEESWNLLDLIERTASRDAFRSMKIEELRQLRYILMKCATTASDFDMLFAPKLQLEGVGERG